MANEYIMRGKQISTGKHVYWTSGGAPDFTGQFAPVAAVDLTSISIDYTTSTPVGAGGSPFTAAGGDLIGLYPNPTVAKLHGTLVSSTSPRTNQSLVFDGTEWSPSDGPTSTSQITWWINSIGGNDNNNGLTSGTPLQTFAEFARRLGPTLNGLGTITVNIVNDLSITDPINLSSLQLVDTDLIIKGVPTTISSGVITAVTPINQLSNQAWEVTDSSLANWTVGSRVRIVGGPNDGNIFWVVKQTAAHKARVSAPATLNASDFNTSVTLGSIAVSNNYVVETLPQVYIAEISNITNDTLSISNTGSQSLYLQDLKFVSAIGETTLKSSSIAYGLYCNQCDVGALLTTAPYGAAIGFNNCSIQLLVAQGNCTILSGAVIGTNALGNFVAGNGGVGGLLRLDGDLLFQNACIGSAGFESGNIIISRVGIFDTNDSDAISIGFSTAASVGTGGVVKFFAQTGGLNDEGSYHPPYLYGSGNSGVGIRLYGDAQFLYDGYYVNNITLTGAGGDFRVGQSGLNLQTFNTQTLEAIAVNQTWANLKANYSAGGFNGVVENQSTGASIRPAEATPVTTGVQSNPSWTQTNWYVDPQNSTGLADDGNSGIDGYHPVRTFNGGIVSKWGTTSPTIRQNTTITWLSSQTDNTDPVIFTPTLIDGYVVLKGNLGASQQIHSGSLASVVAKNRSTGQLLKANLGWAAPVGTLLYNTTAGKSSYAWVYKNVSGTTFLLSQPFSPAVLPFDGYGFPVDTWANGDTFIAYNLISAYIVNVQPTIGQYMNGFPIQSLVQFLNFIDPSGSLGNNNTYLDNADNSVLQCKIDPYVVGRDGGVTDEPSIFWNCFFSVGVFSNLSSSNTEMTAGVLIQQFLSGSAPWSFDYDAIIDASGINNITLGASRGTNSAGYRQFTGPVYVDGYIKVEGTMHFFNTDSGQSVLYGPGTLDTYDTGSIAYASTLNAAQATFLNTGGLRLNGQNWANAFDPITGTWSAKITITPANLDKSFATGGFGGVAVGINGSRLTNFNDAN